MESECLGNYRVDFSEDTFNELDSYFKGLGSKIINNSDDTVDLSDYYSKKSEILKELERGILSEFQRGIDAEVFSPDAAEMLSIAPKYFEHGGIDALINVYEEIFSLPYALPDKPEIIYKHLIALRIIYDLEFTMDFELLLNLDLVGMQLQYAISLITYSLAQKAYAEAKRAPNREKGKKRQERRTTGFVKKAYKKVKAKRHKGDRKKPFAIKGKDDMAISAIANILYAEMQKEEFGLDEVPPTPRTIVNHLKKLIEKEEI